MSKANISEMLNSHVVLGAKLSTEETEKFIGVLAERAAELQAELGVNEVKASLKGVSVKGSGKLEYIRPEGDWRDAILDLVSRVAKLGTITGGLRVDCSALAERWAERRREREAAKAAAAAAAASNPPSGN